MQDAHALALPVRFVASNMRDTFDFRQAYLRLDISKTTTFVGRQELRFGDERLIGISDWTNTSRTFDVIRTVIGNPDNRLDLFSGSVVQIRPNELDTTRGGFYLHGAYATLTTLVPHVRLEPYVLMKTPTVASRQGILGRETLVAPGIRITGKLPANFDYGLEGVLERGAFANDSIRASAGYVKAGYTLHSLPWRPHLQAQYDYASGDPRRDPSVVRLSISFIRATTTFSDSPMFSVGRISSRGASTLIFIRQSPCMFYCMAKLWMSRVPTTPFIRAVVAYWCIHRPADSEVTGLERKSTVHCNTRGSAFLFFGNLGSATSGPALS